MGRVLPQSRSSTSGWSWAVDGDCPGGGAGMGTAPVVICVTCVSGLPRAGFKRGNTSTPSATATRAAISKYFRTPHLLPNQSATPSIRPDARLSRADWSMGAEPAAARAIWRLSPRHRPIRARVAPCYARKASPGERRRGVPGEAGTPRVAGRLAGGGVVVRRPIAQK